MVSAAAGSGKTSVALHRIAYLLYHDRDRLKSSNILILSPNSVFSDYISHVLPELGEEHIREIEGVLDVHHIHIWSIDGYNNCATMHIVTKNPSHCIKEEIRNSKADRVCANCGAAIEENTIFCPFCGQKLEFTTEED